MLTPNEVENDSFKVPCEVENVISDNDLQKKVEELEKEKKKNLEEFNLQRGKLQKYYLSKEEESKKLTLEVERLTKELDEAKSKLCVAGLVKEDEMEEEKRKAQTEIATLNRLLRDAVEVSNTSQEDIQKLHETIKHLENEIKELRNEKDRDKEGILSAGTSNVLSVTKTLARKVVGQLGSDNEVKQLDNLEDNMKKAQEDVEVLRSLVVPLEEEIQALKDKLRSTDERLRKYEPLGGEDVGGTQQHYKTPSPAKSIACGMCSNYEAQLVAQQQASCVIEKEKEALEDNLTRFREDLVKETEFRKQMEHKWNESKEEHKLQVTELRQQYKDVSNELKDLQLSFTSILQDTQQQLSSLTADREKTYREMRQLQDENDKLIGKHTVHSSLLTNEDINLPNDVEELHLTLLKLREELITEKVAKEMKDDQEKAVKIEMHMLTEQMENEQVIWAGKETNMTADLTSLKRQLDLKEKERQKLHRINDELRRYEIDNSEKIKMLEAELSRTQEKLKISEDIAADRQRQISSLQQGLHNSEAVQKDFVRLSQSLQIDLEKIREADTDVRWKHPDDVTECQGCKLTFTSSKQKIHCNHCGHMFCPPCLSYTVKSGPNRRSTSVCQVCHTLLNRETAPYFSQKPPHTPD